MVVSPAGVMVLRYAAEDGTQRIGVAFAEQAHTVDELDGSWTKLGISGNGSGTYAVAAAAVTYDANGASTSMAECADVATCVPVTDRTLKIAASPDGGFIRTDSFDGSTDRTFAYRSGTGDLMLVQADSDGGIGFWTPQGVGGLPNVGARTRSFDNLIGSNLQANGGVSDTGAITVLSVDATANTWVRSRRTASGARYAEILAAMGLKGMGISPLSLPEIASFDLSVLQPQ